MTRMLRWQYALPRLALLIVVLLAAQFVLGYLVRWQVVRSGERSVGAVVEVGDTRVSLLGGRVTIRDVRVANTEAPMRNLLEADRCEFQFEPKALLHKQTIVERGRIDGLRFGTDRATSGAIADSVAATDAPLPGWLDDEAITRAREWLDRLHEKFERDLVEQLDSIRLTDELLARWPQECESLVQRVRELRERTSKFQTQVRQAEANPLRHGEVLDQMPDELARIRADVNLLNNELQDLPDLTKSDRRAIVAARKHDEQFLKEELRIESIDPNVLTAYLLQQRLTGPVADLVGWLRWIRRMVPAEKPRQVAERKRHHRGREVAFVGCPRVPDFVVRSLDLRGTARLGGQSIELVGTLSDLSDEPALHGQPMRLRLTTTGSMPLELQATIDRTGPVARDQLLVDCGGIVLPKLLLGGSNKLRLSLAPTTASINVSLTLEGDRLSGDVQLVQKQVQISPSVGEGLEHVHLADALAGSLGDIRAVATRISLRGTLDEPRCELWSNIGPAVAEAMDRALARTANYQAGQMLAQAQEKVGERLAELDRQIAEQQSELRPQLAGSNDTLELLAGDRRITGRLSFEQLGCRLPADSLFR